MTHTNKHGRTWTNTQGLRRLIVKSVVVSVACSTMVCGRADDAEVALQLARQLSSEGAHQQAAVEFRRLALKIGDAPDAAGYYWAAGREYVEVGEYETAERLLDRAEDDDPDIVTYASFLRAEAAHRRDQEANARFHYRSLLKHGEPALQRYAARRLAIWDLRAGDTGRARQRLSALPFDESAALEALDAYAEAPKKSPRVGGLLGMLPGFGHFYSGEWANGARALILNGLFIYGLVDTADEEQWGAFTVIAFFELTWYSGSIYGGIDAAHRFNKRLLRRTETSMQAGMRYEPEYEALPSLRLNFNW